MPQYLHPGVYVQEVPSAVRPIQGVSTSTAAFIGVADKGPVPGTILPSGRPAQPVLVTSFTEYTRKFGAFRQDSFLTYAVQAFFQNGGSSLYVIRVIPPPASPPSNNATAATAAIGIGPATLNISAANQGAWGNKIWVMIGPSSDGDLANNFKLQVMYGATAGEAQGNVVETYDNVTFNGSPNLQPGAANPATYARQVVNRASEYIAITGDFTARPSPGSPPTVPTQLTNGADGNTGSVSFIGAPPAPDGNVMVTGTGIFALDKINDVSLIVIPGQGDIVTVNAGIEYCKNQRPLQDCFFIGDMGTLDVNQARTDNGIPSVATVSDAKNFATIGMNGQIDKAAGDYGAIYFPWVFAPDPIGQGRNPRILLPPSAFMAGIYARIDNARGVFKAPAGTEAGVAGALAPYVAVSDTEQDQLNPILVNVIRSVPGSGLVVWGTRTIGSDPSWRYIPVRRMAIFLRASIYNGIQWAVFEPNDEPLWASLRLNIRAFMLTQFRAGAFQGSKPDDAFFVLCDSSTTTQQDIDNGVVNILVGFAPLKPAEFVVLKLSQKVSQPAT